MALHRIENGIRFDLSEDEELEVRANWEKKRLETERKIEEKRKRELQRQEIIQKLAESLNMAQEEINTIIK